MVIPVKLYDNEVVKTKVSGLLENLGISHNSIENYILAFVHRSFVNEKADVINEHNERLEFLGDAVLELVITNKLFKDFPEKPEGELTDLRSSLVRGRNLAKVAKSLNLQEYLILGKWEDISGGRENDYILANTVESFLGAIFLDSGYEIVNDFILKHIYTTLDRIIEEKEYKDPKSTLQEITQASITITPTYEVLSEVGPDHDKVFTIWVYLGSEKIAEWVWSSKKKGQEDAAQNALNNQKAWIDKINK